MATYIKNSGGSDTSEKICANNRFHLNLAAEATGLHAVAAVNNVILDAMSLLPVGSSCSLFAKTAAASACSSGLDSKTDANADADVPITPVATDLPSQNRTRQLMALAKVNLYSIIAQSNF